MEALHDIVKSGKALYAGISNYNAEQTKTAIQTLKKMGMHMLIHQENYSMFNRRAENGLTDVLREEGVGCIAFCPLAKGMLTSRYLNGIPEDSRAKHDPRFLRESDITEEKLEKIRALDEIAKERNQTLAQMALAWCLRNEEITSVLIGASKPEQVKENVLALDANAFSDGELARIDAILGNN